MKASKFSEAQIAFVLKQAEDGAAVAEVCRKAGISQATYFNWKKKYAGLMPSEMKRLRQLEDENAKLKRIVADLSLDKAMLQDVLSKKALKPGRKRELVDKVRSDWKVSIRRLFDASDRSRTLRLQVEPWRPGRSQAPDQGHLRDAGKISISPDQARPRTTATSNRTTASKQANV
jgi:putative transposase